MPGAGAPRPRVLILDDQARVRDLVALWLAYARCPTAEAANRDDALVPHLERYQAARSESGAAPASSEEALALRDDFQ